jgi:hypothetical protein
LEKRICSENHRCLGDINGNGIPGIDGVIEILRLLAGMDNEINRSNYAKRASLIVDQNVDSPTINDAIEILRWIAGMASERLDPVWGKKEDRT